MTNIALLVLGSGGAGGFLAWVYSVSTVGQPLPLPWWAALPASVVLGMGAGFLGVFLLANSDTRDIRALVRCIAFAVLCGFSWLPAYEAGGALIDQKIKQVAERRASSLSNASQKLAMALPSVQPQLLPAKSDEIAKTTSDLLKALSQTENSNVRRQGQWQAEQAVFALKQVATREPEKVAKALREIGVAAVETNQIQVADLATTSLADIGKETKDSKVVPAVYSGIESVALVAEATDKHKFAIDSRYKGAQAVVTAAKVASKQGNTKALQTFPLLKAQNDLIDATKFYESTRELDKAKTAETQLVELREILSKVKMNVEQ